jgi:hypothetical protein
VLHGPAVEVIDPRALHVTKDLVRVRRAGRDGEVREQGPVHVRDTVQRLGISRVRRPESAGGLRLGDDREDGLGGNRAPLAITVVGVPTRRAALRALGFLRVADRRDQRLVRRERERKRDGLGRVVAAGAGVVALAPDGVEHRAVSRARRLRGRGSHRERTDAPPISSDELPAGIGLVEGPGDAVLGDFEELGRALSTIFGTGLAVLRGVTFRVTAPLHRAIRRAFCVAIGCVAIGCGAVLCGPIL